jgi:hypothetical protein
MSRQNENGLTWSRWLAAATFGVRGKVSSRVLRQMRAAWDGGDCPCDWAAHLAGR